MIGDRFTIACADRVSQTFFFYTQLDGTVMNDFAIHHTNKLNRNPVQASNEHILRWLSEISPPIQSDNIFEVKYVE